MRIPTLRPPGTLRTPASGKTSLGHLSQVEEAAPQPRASGCQDAVATGCSVDGPGPDQDKDALSVTELNMNTSCAELWCGTEPLRSKLKSPKNRHGLPLSADLNLLGGGERSTEAQTWALEVSLEYRPYSLPSSALSPGEPLEGSRGTSSRALITLAVLAFSSPTGAVLHR